MRYFNGEVKIIATDLWNAGFGVPWGHTRSYSNQLTAQNDGTNGNSWRVAEWPYMVKISSTEFCVVVGTIYNAQRFTLASEVYTSQFWAGVTLTYDSDNNQYLYTDANGYITAFYDFSDDTATALQGMFKSFTDLGGNVTSPTYDATTHLITSVSQSSGSFSREISYSYVTVYIGDSPVLMLQKATLMVNGEYVRNAYYEYYADDDSNGSPGDLKRVTISLGSEPLIAIAQTYYRYYTGGSAHLLKYLIGPTTYVGLLGEGYTNDTIPTISDADLAECADNYFEYDGETQNVTHEAVMGGAQTFDFTYTTDTDEGYTDGFNNWKIKTVETLTNGSLNTVYTNYAGQVLLTDQASDSGDDADHWLYYNNYDTAGRLTNVYHPTAVASYVDSYYDLGMGVTLNSSGFQEIYAYYSGTDIDEGAVEGYMSSYSVQSGTDTDTTSQVKGFEYTSWAPGATTIYPRAMDILYPVAGETSPALQYVYTYTWQDSTLLMETKTTAFPIVPTDQNGAGGDTPNTRIDVFDAYGNRFWAKDERGFITNWTYDWGTGAVTQLIQDVNTGIETPPYPLDWSNPTDPGGLNLITDYTVDGLGRVTQELGPSHAVNLSGTSTTIRRAKWTVYQDYFSFYYSEYTPPQVWRGAGYAMAGYPYYVLINPVAVTFLDQNSRITDQILALRSSPWGALAPDDPSSFPQSTWVAWTHTDYAMQLKPARVQQYYDVPYSGGGSAGTNYNQTSYEYNEMGWLIRQQTQDGTITWFSNSDVGWKINIYMGTDDYGGTEANPTNGGAGGNNMVLVKQNQYDNGIPKGDGMLTQVYLYTTSDTNYEIDYAYDFRDRLISAQVPGLISRQNTYDNLNRVTMVQQFDDESHLVAQFQTWFDYCGRVFQTEQDAVNAGETTGYKLINNIWYDPSGNVIQVNQAGSSLLVKTARDGLSRPTTQYQSLSTSTSYPYPIDVAEVDEYDTVFQQTETTFDDASNITLRAVRQRFDNATGTGPLTYPGGSQPLARVSYVANWPDPLGRLVSVANYGTNEGSPLTPPTTPPSSSATVLVTAVAYNNLGLPYQVTDALGTVNQSTFDALGRLTQLLENYVVDGSGADENRETDYVYHANGQVYTMTVVNATTGNQVTTYNYGTTLSNSNLASNLLLRTIEYPDGEDVVMSYNGQGQVATKTDQLGTVHALAYDALGRLSSDTVTLADGSEVDGTVLSILYYYDPRGMLYYVRSLSVDTVINEVQMVYNDFGQLATQLQEHYGYASEYSPSVQYTYVDGTGNIARLTSLTYPSPYLGESARMLNLDYGTTGETNDKLSRVASLIDDGGSSHLADYTYVGLGRVAQVNSVQPGTMLTYIQLSSSNPTAGSGIYNGGDKYTGWDLFGRIIDQRWVKSTTDLDRMKYGYDQAGNRLWGQNFVETSGQDEFYTYDGLYRLLTLQRGTLNSGRTGITGTPAWEEDFTLDPTGNWNSYVNKISGTGIIDQARTATEANAIATLAGSSEYIAQDVNGNVTTAPVPDPEAFDAAYTLVYDAWNRLVTVTNDEDEVVATYAYDGQGRRIQKVIGDTTRDYYYTAQWQIIEEQVTVDDTTTVDRQNVWGLLGVDNLVLRDRPGISERMYAFTSADGVTAIVNADGEVQERYGYDAYGTPLFMSAIWVPSDTSDYDWDTLYGGYHYDSETGFYQVRNRYLHPTLGRWLSRDPSGYAGGVNLYAYVGGSPTNRIDPMGLGPTLGYEDDSGRWQGTYRDPSTGQILLVPNGNIPVNDYADFGMAGSLFDATGTTLNVAGIASGSLEFIVGKYYKPVDTVMEESGFLVTAAHTAGTDIFMPLGLALDLYGVSSGQETWYQLGGNFAVIVIGFILETPEALTLGISYGVGSLIGNFVADPIANLLYPGASYLPPFGPAAPLNSSPLTPTPYLSGDITANPDQAGLGDPTSGNLTLSNLPPPPPPPSSPPSTTSSPTQGYYCAPRCCPGYLNNGVYYQGNTQGYYNNGVYHPPSQKKTGSGGGQT